MPYRLDLSAAPTDVLDRLVDLGALDIDQPAGGGVAALMPDDVDPERVARALSVAGFSVSPATGRDEGSVWILRPRPIRVGRIQIVPADSAPVPGAIRLIDAAAFGTGLHPTTALCLEMLDEIVQADTVESVLDVGTGSGILALAALALRVPRATALDVDEEALRVAAENARLNGLERRLELRRGGPDAATGTWPLVLANVVAGVLIEIAPALARRAGHRGTIVLSGIATSLQAEVERTYRHLGLRSTAVKTRGGWVALMMQASW